jgi:uncharacterized cupredoxin-like copper-binding protein
VAAAEQRSTSCPGLTRPPPERRARKRWAVLFPILVCAAAPTIDWSSAQQVDLVMNDYHFVPDHLTFQHGTAYRLHLINQGKELHEFTAPALFAAATVRDPKVLVSGGHEVSVPPGGSVDVDFVPNRAGQYELTCADHDWAGMVGSVLVK